MIDSDEKDRYLFSAGWFLWALAHIVLFCIGVLFVIKWTHDICLALFGVSTMVTQ